MNEQNEYIKSLLDDYVADQYKRLTTCDHTVDQFADKFAKPVDILVTVTCDGHLGFYIENDGTDPAEFGQQALVQSVMSGVHLLGRYRAKLTVEEWTPFSDKEQSGAIDIFLTMKLAEMDDLMDDLTEEADRG
jgi:hypothetical protein